MSPILSFPLALAAATIAIQKPQTPRWELFSSVAGVLDTNIDRNQERTRSVGSVLGLLGRYRSSGDNPLWAVDYDIAAHQYSNSDSFDRVSHRLQVVYATALNRRWGFELAAEGAAKGSTEDRDLSNQLSVQPEFSVRLNKADKLRLRVAFRKRDAPDDPRRNSTNNYGQIAWQRRLDPNRRLELGLRYEVNRAQSPRNHYLRWTYSVGYDARITPQTTFKAELRYRPRLYTNRLIDNGGNRFDEGFIFDLGAKHRLNDRMELTFNWRGELRNSNDPDKEFEGQTFQVGATFRF